MNNRDKFFQAFKTAHEENNVTLAFKPIPKTLEEDLRPFLN
jgi:hypothetical protein